MPKIVEVKVITEEVLDEYEQTLLDALNEQGYDVTTLPGVGDYIAPRRAIIAPPAV